MKSAQIWLVGSAGLAAALVGCSLAAGLDKFDGVKLATLDGSAPIDVNPRDGDEPFPDDEEPANTPPTPSSNRDAGCDGGGGGANCVPEKRYCERLQTKPSFCQDFDVTGESLTDALAGFSTQSSNGTASLVTTDSKSAPRSLFISQRALADANAKGYFFLNRTIPNTSTRVTVAYDLLIKGRDKGQNRKQDLQRIALGNYPTDWALSLNIGANLATILECRRGEGDGGTGLTCTNNDLPFIPGDNGWTRINIDLLLDRTKGTATMNVSLNGTNTIKDKVFRPHVLPPNAASTPPINVNVGTNYLVGPLGETNYLIDNVIIDHR